MSYIWKYGLVVVTFSLTWMTHIKVTNISKLLQMILTMGFGYFKYVDYSPHCITLITLM